MATKYEEKSDEVEKKLNKLADEFEEKKKAYFTARKNEAIKIIKFLQNRKYRVKINNEQGGFIEFKDDTIPNNKWIVIEVNKKYYISLQSFDIDTHSSGAYNRHILMDRIGIYKNSDEANFFEIVDQEIDLPLNYNKKQYLLRKISGENTEKQEFLKVKNTYTECRAKQRHELIQLLNQEDVNKRKRGMGTKKYKSNNMMCRTFDNTNWKWLEVKGEGKNYNVSLQAFTEDAKKIEEQAERDDLVIKFKKERKVLKDCVLKPFVEFDRIGIYQYDGEIGSTPDAVKRMEPTSIYLPIKPEDINNLKNSMHITFEKF